MTQETDKPTRCGKSTEMSAGILFRCPKCGARRLREGFYVRTQHCICGWGVERAEKAEEELEEERREIDRLRGAVETLTRMGMLADEGAKKAEARVGELEELIRGQEYCPGCGVKTGSPCHEDCEFAKALNPGGGS